MQSDEKISAQKDADLKTRPHGKLVSPFFCVLDAFALCYLVSLPDSDTESALHVILTAASVLGELVATNFSGGVGKICYFLPIVVVRRIIHTF